MAFETLVALEVTDDLAYAAYREAMTPLLTAQGGDFGYDFRVSEVLRAETEAPINRVFTIHFPDEERMKAFFADPEYLAIRAKHFEPSVGHATLIARYEREDPLAG